MNANVSIYPHVFRLLRPCYGERRQLSVDRTCLHVETTEFVHGRSMRAIKNPSDVTRSVIKRILELIEIHEGESINRHSSRIQSYFLDEVTAINCALDIRRITDDRKRRVPHHYLNVRMGLSSGSCIRLVEGARVEYYGSSVELASRLANQGDSGAIAVSEVFHKRFKAGRSPALINFDHEVRNIDGYLTPVSVYFVDSRSENRNLI